MGALQIEFQADAEGLSHQAPLSVLSPENLISIASPPKNPESL